MLPGEPLDDRSGIYPRRWRQSVPRLVRFPRSPGCGESDDRAVAARTRQCVERQMDRRRTWRIPDRLGTGLPALSDAGRRGVEIGRGAGRGGGWQDGEISVGAVLIKKKKL